MARLWELRPGRVFQSGSGSTSSSRSTDPKLQVPIAKLSSASERVGVRNWLEEHYSEKAAIKIILQDAEIGRVTPDNDPIKYWSDALNAAQGSGQLLELMSHVGIEVIYPEIPYHESLGSREAVLGVLWKVLSSSSRNVKSLGFMLKVGLNIPTQVCEIPVYQTWNQIHPILFQFLTQKVIWDRDDDFTARLMGYIQATNLWQSIPEAVALFEKAQRLATAANYVEAPGEFTSEAEIQAWLDWANGRRFSELATILQSLLLSWRLTQGQDMRIKASAQQDYKSQFGLLVHWMEVNTPPKPGPVVQIQLQPQILSQSRVEYGNGVYEQAGVLFVPYSGLYNVEHWVQSVVPALRAICPRPSLNNSLFDYLQRTIDVSKLIWSDEQFWTKLWRMICNQYGYDEVANMLESMNVVVVGRPG